MRRIISLLCTLSLFLWAEALNPNPSLAYRRTVSNTAIGPRWAPLLRLREVCATIQQAISNASAVYYPSDAAYAQDILHYMTSSTQNSVCTVEPGTVGDVSKIVCYISTSQLLISVG